MKREFELIDYPNQRFSTMVDGNSVEITLRTFRGIIYANIAINQVLECAGRPCLPNTRIFPASVERKAGAFMYFKCETGDYPSYDKLGTQECVFTMESIES